MCAALIQRQLSCKTFVLILHFFPFYLQVPAFKHGDIVVNESFAACLYLEVKH